MKTTGLYFSCQIGELAPDTFSVVAFTLEEALSELFTLSLTLVSHHPSLDAEALLLKPGSLTVYVNDTEQRTIHGIVAAMVQGETGFRRTYYSITLRPQMWLLTLDQDSRIYHNSSVPEILASLLKDINIKAKCRFEDPHYPREYITMKRESGYDFFCRLAAEEGITFWFEDEALYYSDTHLSMLADVTLSYNPHPQTPVAGNIMHQFSYGVVMRPGQAIHKDYNYHNPRYALQHTAKGQNEQQHAYSVFESYGRFEKNREGQPFTQYRLEQLRADSKTGTAQSNAIRLRPGKIFLLENHPNAAMNDRWQVVTVRHHGSQPAALEEEQNESGTTLTNTLTFIPGRLDWRPPYRYKPLADGDELASVTGPPGEEIYVNEDGAVRVHFHWNRYDKADDSASCWVRVAQGWNGNGFGFLATPRVGQEVIISYLNGDIDRPIITGCTYNGLNRPPLNLPAEKTRTTFKTQTYKGEGFNELRFDDANGHEEVFIHAQRDMNTVVQHDRTTTVLHDHSESVSGHQTINIQKDQKLTINENQFTKVKQNKLEKITLTSNEVIGVAKTLSVGAGYAVTVGAGMNTAVGLSQSEEIALNKETLVGKKTEIVSGELIEIRCGKSLIRLTKEGLVEIKGTQLSIDQYEAIKDGRYRKQFVLVSEADGQPLANQKYKLMDQKGNELQGSTNEKGETEIFSSDEKENITFELVTD